MIHARTLRAWAVPTMAAAVVHLVFLLCVTPAPISSDSAFYHYAAGRIADGFGYTGDVPYTEFMPGYSFFMAIFYLVFGKHPWIIRVVQVGLLAVSAAVLGMTVERFTDRRVARVAFFLLALLPGWFIFPGTLNAETVLLALETLFLWTIARPLQDLDRARLWTWAAAGGVVAALMALVKAEFFLWLPAVALVAVCQSLPWKRVAQVGAVSSMLFALVLAPWVIRNANTFHRFIPFSTKAGAPLWLSAHQPVLTEYQAPEFNVALAKCEVRGDPKATDDCLAKDAFAMIASHPAYFLRTSVARIGQTLLGSHSGALTGFSISFSEAIQTRQIKVLVVKAILLILNTLFVALGIAGLVWIGSRRLFWFLPYLVGVKLAVHAVMYGTSRYGLHLSPIFAFAAAVWGVEIFRRWRPGRVELPAV